MNCSFIEKEILKIDTDIWDTIYIGSETELTEKIPEYLAEERKQDLRIKNYLEIVYKSTETQIREAKIKEEQLIIEKFRNE